MKTLRRRHPRRRLQRRLGGDPAAAGPAGPLRAGGRAGGGVRRQGGGGDDRDVGDVPHPPAGPCGSTWSASTCPRRGCATGSRTRRCTATPRPARPAPSSAAPSPRSSSAATCSTSTCWPPPWPKGPSCCGRPASRDVELGDFDHRVTLERDGASGDGRLPLGARRHRPRHLPRQAPGADRAQPRAPHGGDLVPLGGRAPHRRRRRPRAALVLPRQRRLPPPRHQPLHGLRLLGLVHPPRQRRDQHRRRLRHPARRSRPQQEPGERLHRLPARRSPPRPSCSTARACRPRTCGPISHLAYVTRQYMGNGWALLGDAAAFLDPYYSPGLDHASFSVEATVEIVKAQTAGEDVAAAHRRAQRDVRALVPPLLPVDLQGQVLLHGRARPARRPRSSSTPRSTTSSWSSRPIASSGSSTGCRCSARSRRSSATT